MQNSEHPPVCNYENSDYQTSFWDQGGRAYEDGCEAHALRRLLPRQGKQLLELGAGAGRNTLRYAGFERVVLLDYSRTQLLQAQKRLGRSDRFIYVAADIYRLPFADHVFDAATMIRVLHHMVSAPAALRQVSNSLSPGATFILEFANKRNLKAILRYVFRRQSWNPFSLDPIEYAPLNFDFHPRAIRAWLFDLDFTLEKTLSISHFRVAFLKKIIPVRLLVWLDSLLQWTGAFIQLTPSVFIRARRSGVPGTPQGPGAPSSIFKCPDCGHASLEESSAGFHCPNCSALWPNEDGIFNFKK